MKDLLSPEKIQSMVAMAAENALPKAIADATQEAVNVLVEAQMRDNILPGLARSLVDAGALPASILAKSTRDDGSSRSGKLEQRTSDPKGLLYDPFTALDQMGFRERNSALTLNTLGNMVKRCPPVTAIVQTRVAQMGALAIPQPDEFSLGCKLKLRDKEMDLTPQLKKREHELMTWIMRCGNPDVKMKRDKFGNFIKKLTRDSLSYDQATAEIIPAKKGTPVWWRALDAATMRIADDLDEMDTDDDSIRYVQIYEESPIAQFTERELLFGVRNPSTDIRMAGYGTSEVEQLIIIVTALLHGIDYNAKFFTQGTVAKGLLNFKGAIPDRELAAFRRQWHAMVTGAVNAWRTPVVNSDDVQWINMQQSNRDMEFASWIDWLLKVTCAVFLIAPEEIGFQYGNVGQSSTLSEGNQEDKLKYSRDKGLVPLATSMAEWINDKIVEPLDDRFVFEFSGINSRTREQAIQLHTQEVQYVKTVDEIRKERGLEPLPNGMGALIMNPTWLAFYQAQQAQQQAQPQGPQLDGGAVDQQAEQAAPPGAEQAPNPGGDVQAGANLDQEAGAEEEQMQRSFGFDPKQERALMKSIAFEVELP